MMFIRWDYIVSHLLIGLTFILGFIFILMKARIFRRVIIKTELSFFEKTMYAIFFGLIGILGTYAGFPVTDGIANTRAVGVIVGGLVGGPYVGLGAGLIAGVHRFFFGGFTAYASATSAVVEGVVAGLCYTWFRTLPIRWLYALALGFLLESLHMGILLLMARPFEQAIRLVQAISPSMLILDPLGIAVFIAILDSLYGEQEKVEGKAAQMALQIAGKTLAYLRKGLNEESARNTAQTILDSVNMLDAVAVTSTNKVLAFVGTGADHHMQGIITLSTMDVIESGQMIVAQKKRDIGCTVDTCPLQSKVVVPLKDHNTVIGTLVLYKTTPNSITPFDIELIGGLAQLISMQIEVSKVDQQSNLRALAEIRALQAQINPHFLFNALNTIAYYCRSQPETARQLLTNLGDYYRSNVSFDEWVDLQTELYHIDAYAKIEEARFQGKLKIVYDIPEKCHIKVPALILQPIVENAIKHGLYPKKSGGCVSIRGQVQGDQLLVVVEDDGVGIKPELLQNLLTEDTSRKSIGLSNVHQRLKAIFGDVYGLHIESVVGQGTRVLIPFPLRKE
jgi:two-component system, LytTR family, sensor histidine kinase LytS